MTRRADYQEAKEKFGLEKADLSPTRNYLAVADGQGLSEQEMREAVEMAALGAFERAIARVLGVPENRLLQALYDGKTNKTSKYKEFSRAFYAARKGRMIRYLSRVDEAVEEDWKAASWQLERSFGFAKQETVEHEVAPQTLSLMALAQIPLEDARAVIEAESVVVEDDSGGLPPAA